MLDMKWIRENPEAFDASLTKRGGFAMARRLIALDEEKRKRIAEIQDLQARKNHHAKALGMIADKKGLEFQEAREEGNQLKNALSMLEDAHEKDDELERLLAELPNILHDDVPEGDDENANVEVRKWGEPTQFHFTPKEHSDLGPALGMMDFEDTAKISGARFVTLKKDLSRMERALAAFMIDIHTKEFGFEEVTPPALVREHALFGTGQLPKFAEDNYSTTDGYWLIPTAEVALTNLVREKILEEAELPIRMTACTPCFRSEAGSAGKDTKGMIRMHQFTKVEMVVIASEDTSWDEHERMTKGAETILQRLELPYRVVILCSGDIGFGAQKTYDLEVWLPGQQAYREISSCSNCGPFQARRMKARYRKAGQKENRFVHTLNGSGLAVGRTMVAILENYQQEDGSIRIPEALRPYMGGQEEIRK